MTEMIKLTNKKWIEIIERLTNKEGAKTLI